ncbi:hypothetical protein [Labrys monachus]|uniref:Uncharacterized protein n=1 Tax=Labrys monachus TaxID=217067 RepID=A0ABU0FBN6_9HYPH|nr:hypothetical protein [Labrys monachus]MDQ0391846.1 hypothetical protein [Labrys monachus]
MEVIYRRVSKQPLRASYEQITALGRGRRFGVEEQARIRAMIGEGYGAQAFADLSVETGGAPFDAVLGDLVSAVARRIGR